MNKKHLLVSCINVTIATYKFHVLRCFEVVNIITFFYKGTGVPVLPFDKDGSTAYSPTLAVPLRGDAMAQRLKEMKEKRENLSPTGNFNSEFVVYCFSLRMDTSQWSYMFY